MERVQVMALMAGAKILKVAPAQERKDANEELVEPSGLEHGAMTELVHAGIEKDVCGTSLSSHRFVPDALQPPYTLRAIPAFCLFARLVSVFHHPSPRAVSIHAR